MQRGSRCMDRRERRMQRGSRCMDRRERRMQRGSRCMDRRERRMQRGSRCMDGGRGSCSAVRAAWTGGKGPCSVIRAAWAGAESARGDCCCCLMENRRGLRRLTTSLSLLTDYRVRAACSPPNVAPRNGLGTARRPTAARCAIPTARISAPADGQSPAASPGGYGMLLGTRRVYVESRCRQFNAPLRCSAFPSPASIAARARTFGLLCQVRVQLLHFVRSERWKAGEALGCGNKQNLDQLLLLAYELHLGGPHLSGDFRGSKLYCGIMLNFPARLIEGIR